MIRNLDQLEIKTNKTLKESFINANFEDQNLICNIYKGNFYLDSFNFFPIDNKYRTFESLFRRDIYQNFEHFYSKEFYNNFLDNIKNLKIYDNILILGSNAANNYYSNLLHFLPRIFFINKNNIKIAIHRNSSNKFRQFIKKILQNRNIDFTFVYLDDGFYNFTNSLMPQFFNLGQSIKILNNFLKVAKGNSKDKKIYVTREDSSYRRIINEADIVPILRSKGYKVINPQLYSIEEQINIFSNADKIIAAHGSNLSNIIFCKPETEIFEIGPNFSEDYEKIFENRYKNLAEINHLKYSKFIGDIVPVTKHPELAKKFIHKKILDNSNYYKNLIVKIKDIKEIE